MLNDHRIGRTVWKIQISMRVNFISSKDTGETHTIYAWSDNLKIIWGNGTDDIIRKLFKSLLNNYQKESEIISGSEFHFESVELMDYKLRVGLYIKFPEWVLYKGATINPKNENDDKCFQYGPPLALNYNEIKKKELENIFKKIKHEDKDFSSHQRDWKKF